jgi:predicted GIY-YIG superfamily endonuclease
MKFCVYLLRCSNGTYYVGHTDNIARRLEEHNSGKGAEHTRKYRPVSLIYTEPVDSESAAKCKSSGGRRPKRLRWRQATFMR